MGILKGFFGGAPKSSPQTIADLNAKIIKAKSSRAALYATSGGAAGSELDPTQVKKRETLFGN